MLIQKDMINSEEVLIVGENAINGTHCLRKFSNPIWKKNICNSYPKIFKSWDVQVKEKD